MLLQNSYYTCCTVYLDWKHMLYFLVPPVLIKDFFGEMWGIKFRMPNWSVFIDFLAPDAKHFFLYFSRLFMFFYYLDIINMLLLHIELWFCSVAQYQPTFEVIVKWFGVCWNTKLGRIFSISSLKDSFLSKYIESSN